MQSSPAWTERAGGGDARATGGFLLKSCTRTAKRVRIRGRSKRRVYLSRCMWQGRRLLRHAELACVNRMSARRRCASNWSVAREDLHAHSKACRDTRSVHTGVPLTDDPSLVGRSRGAPAGDHGCVRVREHEYGMPQPRPCMRDSNHSVPTGNDATFSCLGASSTH